ncbi:GMP synthase-like glutamine amidotransferase [Methanolinea mesophila]|uniref:type 1 glutamine amidotransferase n=1 Tax=Methanolinea mesophila TaxID=547055 RepID=UPI001AE153C3|nr:type 1 glutamine amidotransferase [Methanolinea mesophila]MBP1928650.1 GMP synthase-like glutamine amidotransferase [Methanolinea mesophila]
MITIFQHGEQEPPGVILDILKEGGHEAEVVPLYRTGEVDPAILPDRLVILGGVMSVNDEKEYPFLSQEKALIRRCIADNRPVLGLCLGAQMIASAMGCRVYPGIEEKGWNRVSSLVPLPGKPVPEDFFVFQWHRDTFDLPGSARLMVKGERVPHQMFSLGSALGVQFHMEVTGEIIARWGKTLDEPQREKILSDTRIYLDRSISLCRETVNRFASMENGRWQ